MTNTGFFTRPSTHRAAGLPAVSQRLAHGADTRHTRQVNDSPSSPVMSERPLEPFDVDPPSELGANLPKGAERRKPEPHVQRP
jgi:hypothetical protein